jgi:prepilin-type processing-associated H-X9-DG protein
MAGIYMYAADHKNQLPKNLQALVDGKYISPKQLISPLQPDREDAYVYIRPAAPLNKVDPQSLILYEAFDTWGEGTNVAFGDGHVEFVGDKAKFDAMLAKARQAAAESKPAPPARP